MTTMIRPETSKKNKYWIDKHRHYELKHFCLQYPEWKRAYIECDDIYIPACKIVKQSTANTHANPTEKRALIRAYYSERIRMIERAAYEADRVLYRYILKAVTEGLSYTYLKSKLKIPCGKDMYYDRYRRFFWLLNRERG